MKPPFVTTGSDNHVADHNHLITQVDRLWRAVEILGLIIVLVTIAMVLVFA